MVSMSKYQHGIRKIEVTYVPVTLVGFISSSVVIYAVRPGKTVPFNLMLANNESVALHPVAKLATRCLEFQVLFHTDVLQAFG